jgi:hypothetical protein
MERLRPKVISPSNGKANMKTAGRAGGQHSVLSHLRTFSIFSDSISAPSAPDTASSPTT